MTMHYSSGRFWFPHDEGSMATIEVASGCSHGACAFCDLEGSAFIPATREEIARRIDDMADCLTYAPKRFLLTGGNALGLPHGDLAFALERIRERFGNDPIVSCFANVTDIMTLDDDTLRELRSLGLDCLDVEADSGSDPVLSFMGKGFAACDVVEQCARLESADITYNLYYLAGAAGKGSCEDAARETAAVFSSCKPRRVIVHSLCAFRETTLADRIADGAFEPANEVEILREIRTLVSELSVPTYVSSSHMSNSMKVGGSLPRHRDELLDSIDDAIEQANEANLHRFRMSIREL